MASALSGITHFPDFPRWICVTNIITSVISLKSYHNKTQQEHVVSVLWSQVYNWEWLFEFWDMFLDTIVSRLDTPSLGNKIFVSNNLPSPGLCHFQIWQKTFHLLPSVYQYYEHIRHTILIISITNSGYRMASRDVKKKKKKKPLIKAFWWITIIVITLLWLHFSLNYEKKNIQRMFVLWFYLEVTTFHGMKYLDKQNNIIPKFSVDVFRVAWLGVYQRRAY